MDDPSNKKDLQRFLGMVNYLRSFIPNMADLTENLRPLLRNGIIFSWQSTHSAAIKTLKEKISSAPVLSSFDVNKSITIQTYSSKSGIGSVLLQNNKQPISYASRSLTDTEVNYAQVERSCWQ